MVRVLRTATRSWQISHGTVCPGIEQLIGDGVLYASVPLTDAWGHPFHIACEGHDVSVRSRGRDGVLNTADDIVSPSKVGEAGQRLDDLGLW